MIGDIALVILAVIAVAWSADEIMSRRRVAALRRNRETHDAFGRPRSASHGAAAASSAAKDVDLLISSEFKKRSL